MKYGTDPKSGSRIGPTIRVGNRQLRDIPAADRLLELVCPAGGSRKGGSRLVAVVDKNMTLQLVKTPMANAAPGVVYTPCRCGLNVAKETEESREGIRKTLALAGLDPSVDPGPTKSRGHFLDVAKVLDAVERLRSRPLKARRVDVDRVATNPPGSL